MDDWQKSFTEKLSRVQSRWVTQFDEALDAAVVPVFNGLADFLRHNGIATRVPLRESGRRSLKFELAEDAYLLMIFRATGFGEFELSCESFAPDGRSDASRVTERVSHLNDQWIRRVIQGALDAFVDLLAGTEEQGEEKAEEELAAL